MNQLIARYKETLEDSLFEEILFKLKRRKYYLYVIEQKYGFEPLEAKSILFEALLKSIDLFDESKGVGFDTYLHVWVKALINKRCMERNHLTLPPKTYTIAKKIDTFYEDNPNGTQLHLKEHLKVSSKKVFNTTMHLHELASSEKIPLEVFEDSLVVDIEDDNDNLDLIFEVAEAILDDRSYQILNMYYVDGMTLHEIAKDFNISHEYVRYINKKSIKLIKESL